MKAKNIFKFILIVCVLSFTFLIIASQSGYSEYELSKKRQLTDEAIERFEQDVKDGKDIDIDNYVVNEKKDYNNAVSNFGNKFSNKVEMVFSKGFDYLFKYLNEQSDN